jgi:hypothetical protein
VPIEDTARPSAPLRHASTPDAAFRGSAVRDATGSVQPGQAMENAANEDWIGEARPLNGVTGPPDFAVASAAIPFGAPGSRGASNAGASNAGASDAGAAAWWPSM